MKLTCFNMIPGKTYLEFQCGCISDKFYTKGNGKRCRRHKSRKVIHRHFICTECTRQAKEENTPFFHVETRGPGRNMSLCFKHARASTRWKYNSTKPKDEKDPKKEKSIPRIVYIKPRGASNMAEAAFKGIPCIPAAGLIQKLRGLSRVENSVSSKRI